MNKKLNSLPVGLALGLFAPLLIFAGFYGLKFSHLAFGEFLDIMITRNVIVQIISLCVIVNLLIFFLFIWTHNYYAARGIIMATFVYTIGVIIFKFL